MLAYTGSDFVTAVMLASSLVNADLTFLNNGNNMFSVGLAPKLEMVQEKIRFSLNLGCCLLELLWH